MRLAQRALLRGPGKNWAFCIKTGMLLSLLFCFYADSILLFYVFFESRAFLIFFFVLSFGYQPERYLARSYLLLFTALSSFPFLARVLVLGGQFSVETFGAMQ